MKKERNCFNKIVEEYFKCFYKINNHFFYCPGSYFLVDCESNFSFE